MKKLSEIIGTPSRFDLRVFAAGQIVFFAVLLFWLFADSVPFQIALAGTAVSAVIGIVGLYEPNWIKPVYVVWMTVVFPIGWLVSHVCMALVFYLVVTPIGILKRNLSGDPMERSLDPERKSYWQERSVKKSSESYFRQF